MNDYQHYSPSAAFGASVEKGGDMWTLILVRHLRHSPEKVWRALTDRAHVRQWAPFDVEGDLEKVGSTVKLTWVGRPQPIETKVTRVDFPEHLEFGDIRWQLERNAEGGTRLTLWHAIDRRFISWGAAGWHIGIDSLDWLLAGHPIGRVAGADAMKFEGWQRLNLEYAKQFGMEPPKTQPQPKPRQNSDAK
jgi:uncharacterized protein YndB with AHSA1/START domain